MKKRVLAYLLSITMLATNLCSADVVMATEAQVPVNEVVNNTNPEGEASSENTGGSASESAEEAVSTEMQPAETEAAGETEETAGTETVTETEETAGTEAVAETEETAGTETETETEETAGTEVVTETEETAETEVVTETEEAAETETVTEAEESTETEDMTETVEETTEEVTETEEAVETEEAAVMSLSAEDEDYNDFTEDAQIGSYSFGTDITVENTYSSETGIGFSKVEYTEEAAGWVNNVYYPRVVTETEGDASYVAAAEGALAISSKVWTETESSGYGVYTYENTATFDMDLANADYKVEVSFTNPTDSAYTAYVEAEDITKASDISVAAKGTATVQFTAVLVDGQLNLKFLAPSTATTESDATTQTVYVSKVTVTRLATNESGEKPTVFIASDSTVQTYEKNYYPQTGWGQVLNSFFGETVEERECDDCNYSQAQTYETVNVTVENRAIGGRSSKSFIDEGKLDDLLEDVKPGDYLLIQWGHNDATYSRPNRYVASTDFEKWIQVYVDGAIQRGATPVLVTPVARYSYTTDTDGNLVSFASNFEAYRQVMLKMAEEQGLAYVDLTQRSIDVCNNFGIEGAKSLFLHLNAGDYPEGAYAGGVSDSTHLQYYGAYKFAQCVAQGILESENAALDSLKEKVVLNIPENVPGTVSGLTATSVGASSVSMTWDVEADAELYYIYRAVVESEEAAAEVDFSAAAKYSVSSTNKYTDTGCEGGKTYVYAICGFNEKGTGSFSEQIVVTTKSAGYKFDFNYNDSPTMEGWIGVNQNQAYDAELGYGWLSAPGNGRYRSGNGNEDSSDMADDFCLGAGEFAVDLPNGDYEITFYACDLLPGTSTIKPGYTAEGLSAGSISTKQALGSCTSTVRVTDGQLNIVVGGTNQYINGMTITELLLAPSGLVATEMSFDGTKATFLIGFNPVGEAVSYNIYKKGTSDKEFSVVKSFTAAEYQEDELGCRAMSADLGEVYQYYMTCVTADGTESAPSETITVEALDSSVATPAAPANVVCLSPTDSDTELKRSITISWDAVDSAIKYIVYRSEKAEGTKGFTGFEKIGEASGTSYTDGNGVATNISYYYKVAAMNAGGIGELSEACKTPVTGKLVAGGLEDLTDRALVAINLAGGKGAETLISATDADGNEYTEGAYLSWRSFEEDFTGGELASTFTVYCNDEVIAENISKTNLIYPLGKAGDVYKVVGSNDEALGLKVIDTQIWDNQYLDLNLYCPEDATMPDGTTCDYSANDMSVGDLDGDGQLELIVKWYPSNAKDNSGSGYTGKTFLDGYDVNFATGEVSLMWRIDMGVNIRSGAHYTQFQVWDYDNDGKSEIAVKTADGTTSYKSTDGRVDGLEMVAYVGACDASALPVETVSTSNDYRNATGYVLEGPEYFSIFNGEDGTKAAQDVDYTPERGSVSAWGDAYGNRVDRFISATAYLDGETPFAVFARGYYTRTCLTAYYLADSDGDGIGDTIKEYWAFDTNDAGTQYEAQGNHGISVNDIDNDGKDEIIYGALTIDHDGTVKYSTGLGHGDAMHVSDWVSWNEGLEIMAVHEHDNAAYHVEIHDAETGEVLMGYYTGKDTGRGVASDIDPTAEGAEWWSIASPTYESNDEPEWDSTNGEVYSSHSTLENLIKLSNCTPASNATLFWDGDLLAEVLDHTFNKEAYAPTGTVISKWNYEAETQDRLLYSTEIWSNNGTKGNPGLCADILGDWREEVITRCSADKNKVRIYTTTIETDYVVPCLLEDLAYREGVAWQNTGYNQPANTSYLLSEGLVTAQLTAGEVTPKSAEIYFTAASDGVNGGDITAYEIYRATEGEYEKIDTVAVEDLVKANAAGEADADSSQNATVYFAEDFEDGVNDSFALVSSANSDYEYLEADTATVNNNTSSYVYGVGARSGGDTATQVNGLAVDKNAKVTFDVKMDACMSGKSSSIALLGAKNTYNWLSSDSEILTITATANGNGYWGSVTVNGTDITAKANVNNGTANGESSGKGGLLRDTTGWLRVTAEIDFENQKVNVVITRISDGSEVFSGEVAFVDAGVTALDTIYMAAGKVYGGVFVDNVSVTEIVEVSVEDTKEQAETRYVYTDNQVSANTTYSYKIAAVVNSKTSHMSREVSLTTGIDIAEVKDIVVKDIVQDTVLEDGKTVVDLLPQTATVVDTDGNEAEVLVSWDASNVDISKVGVYTAYASIKGYAKNPIEVSVNVIENAILGQEDVVVYVVVNTEIAASLPATVNLNYLNKTTQAAAVTWSADGIDTTKITGEEEYYEMTGVVDGTAYEVTAKVHVLDNYVVSFDPINIEVTYLTENVEEFLPETVTATYADGTVAEAAVNWNAELIDATVLGTQTVEVTVEKYSEAVTANVNVVYPLVAQYDFGITAGAIAEGWTEVTVNGKGGTKTNEELGISYTTEKGYGFLNGANSIQGRKEDYTFAGALPSEVYTDFAIPDGNTFAVDLENGEYEVTVVSGSVYKSTVKCTVEGTGVSVSNAAGSYATASTIANVTDGQLTVEFTTGATSRTDALIIRKVIVPVIDVEALALSQSEVLMTAIGETVTLEAIVTPENATDKTVLWATTDETVAMVEDGVVTAVANGTAVISAETNNGIKAECTITVKQASENVTITYKDHDITNTALDISRGIYSFGAIVTPENVAEENAQITWTTSDSKIACVLFNKYVLIYGVGEVTLTATTADGVAGEVVLNVVKGKVKVSGIELSAEETVVKVGDKLAINAEIAPITVERANLQWTSSDKRVAVVDKNGVVYAKQAGTVTITATAGEKRGRHPKKEDAVSASIEITVEGLMAPTVTSIESQKKGSVKLAWENREEVSGYEIMVSERENGKYKVTAVKDAEEMNATIGRLKSGRTYYFKVRSFVRVGFFEKVYSEESEIVTVKVK